MLSGPEEHTVLFGPQLGIAEPDEPPGVLRRPRQDPGHRPALPGGVGESLPQIEEAAALGHCGQTGFDLLFYLAQKRVIFAQCFGMKLRVAAGQIQPADFLRQACVPERAKKDRLCPGVPERFQRLGIGEAEGFVLCHSDADAGRGCLRLPGQGGRLFFAEGQQAGPVDLLLRRCGQCGQLFLQVLHLCRRIEAEMAAPDDGLRELGQEAQHRQARFRFQHGGQQGVHPGRAVVEQDARKMAGGAEAVEAPQLCGQRQALALRLHHQQHRQAQRVGQMPRAGLVAHTAEAIVEAHRPLTDRRAVAGGPLRVEGAHRFGRGEKEVEVVALHP